ncbi:hypothetical protein V8B97DRAFT_1917898 [Scleroderma yunnanense]
MATEPSTSTTPMNVPIPSAKHMVANAAKAVDVVWGQLWHVEAVVGDLPASFIMPTYIIAVDCFMVSPETLQKSKTWPPWDNIHHAQDQDVQDHPWFKLQEPVVTEAKITTEMPTVDKGDKNQEDVLHPEWGWTNSWQLKPDSGHGCSRKQQSKQIKSAATVDTNSNGGAGLSTTVADPTAPDSFSAVEDATQCDWCARQGQAKVAQMEWPSQKNFEVYIQPPAWMLKSKLYDASIMSTIAMSAMHPPTTPTGTMTTTVTYQEHLEDVEEDMFLLKQDYVKMKLELGETHQEVETL